MSLTFTPKTGHNQLNRLPRTTRGYRILFSVLTLSICSCGKQPKAKIENELALTKSVCVNTGFAIRGLSEFRSLKDDSLKIAIYGKKRVLILDAKNRDIVETLSFPNKNGGGSPRLVDVDRDGHPEILYQGGGYDNIGLENKEGKVYWARNRKNFDWAVVDDHDSTRSPRFYIGGDAGIECIDTKGLPVWQVNKQSRRLEIVHSPDEPNHLAVLVGNRDTRIEIYSDKGAMRKVFNTPRQISDFRTIEWPFDLSATKFVALGSGRVYQYLIVFDENGTMEFEHTFPLRTDSIFDIECTLVRFKDEKLPRLAVLAHFSFTSRKSLLCLFELDGDLVYEEDLGQTGALLAVDGPLGKGTGQRLLVGDRDPWRIVEYSKR